MSFNLRGPHSAVDWVALCLVCLALFGSFAWEARKIETKYWPVSGEVMVTQAKFIPENRTVSFSGTFEKYRDCEFRGPEEGINFLVTYLVDDKGGLHRGAVSFGDQPPNAPKNRVVGKQHFYAWRVLAPDAAINVTGLLVDVQHNCHPLWWTRTTMRSTNSAANVPNIFIRVPAAIQ